MRRYWEYNNLAGIDKILIAGCKLYALPLQASIDGRNIIKNLFIVMGHPDLQMNEPVN